MSSVSLGRPHPPARVGGLPLIPPPLPSRVIALGLYVVPLQSSFAKPQTPTETGSHGNISVAIRHVKADIVSPLGQIQHRVMAWVYVALELCVPATIYTALSYSGSLQSVLVSAPPTPAAASVIGCVCADGGAPGGRPSLPAHTAGLTGLLLLDR